MTANRIGRVGETATFVRLNVLFRETVRDSSLSPGSTKRVKDIP